MAPIQIDTLTDANLERAANDIGLDRQQYVALFQVFVERVYQIIGELQAALRADDKETARRSIHTIKGTSQNMRLDMIASPAQDVEELVRSGKSALALAAIAKIQSSMENLIEQAELLGIHVERPD